MTNELKNILEKQRRSQYWLSKVTGITAPDLCAVANGKKCCFPGWRKKISAALNVPEAEIFPESKEAGDYNGKTAC